MNKIKEWFIDLTDKQVLGLAFLNLFVWFPFITLLCGFIFSNIGFLIGLILSVLSFVYLFYLYQIRKSLFLSNIKENYEFAKKKLRQQPKNNQLREKALQAGREYYKSLRNGVLSIYDEQAITNDLSSIASVSQTDNTVQPSINKADDNSQSDIVSKLEKLKQLKDKGIITESEFESKKKDLLDSL